MIANQKQNVNSILEEKKHAEHKLMNNDLILKLKKCHFNKESELVRECSTCLVFSHQQNIITQDKRIKLKKANYCKFRFCSSCNWRRNININRELLEAFNNIESKRKVEYLFLTLTISNCNTNKLKETVKIMNEAFKRMSKTKRYKDTILGHFKALELIGDKTKPKEAHPHFHIILIVPYGYFRSLNYIRQDKWVEMWKKALRVDYNPIVHIQKIKAKRTKQGKKLSALQSAVFEVAKYSVKHSDLTKKPDDNFYDMIIQTKGMRFFATGGILKDTINFIKCDEELINFKEKTEAEWKEIEELIYLWENGDFILHTKEIE